LKSMLRKKDNLKYSGLFIAIEGVDGSGLSTQTKLVVDLLRLRELKAFATKEPTNNVVGGLIRGVLSGVTNFPAEGLQLLFAADRAHHLSREVIPQLMEGNILVSDRYFWTSVAYGGIAMDREWLLEVNDKFLVPDLTIFLDVSPKEALHRIKKDRFELEIFEHENQLLKVRQNYFWLMEQSPKRFSVVKAVGDRDEIAKEIISAISVLPKFSKFKA